MNTWSQEQAELSQHYAASTLHFIEYYSFTTPQRRPIYNFLDGEISNILAAMELAIGKHLYSQLLAMTVAVYPYFETRGLYEAGKALLTKVLESTEAQIDSANRLHVLCQLAIIEIQQGNVNIAEKYLQKGISDAYQYQHRNILPPLLSNLGGILFAHGNLEKAAQIWHEGLSLAQDISDRSNIINFLRQLGNIDECRGNYIHAQNFYQEALGIAKIANYRDHTNGLLNNLGIISYCMGDFDSSADHYSQALQSAQQAEHKLLTSHILGNLGLLELAKSQFALAKQYFEQQLSISRQIGHHERIGNALGNLGHIACISGDYDRSASYLKQSMSIALELNDKRQIAQIHLWCGDLKTSMCDLAAALLEYNQGLDIAQSIDCQSLIGQFYFGLSNAHNILGNKQFARMFGEQSAATLRKIQHRDAQKVENWLNQHFESRL